MKVMGMEKTWYHVEDYDKVKKIDINDYWSILMLVMHLILLIYAPVCLPLQRVFSFFFLGWVVKMSLNRDSLKNLVLKSTKMFWVYM